LGVLDTFLNYKEMQKNLMDIAVLITTGNLTKGRLAQEES
jgi:hypothetical protein